MKIVFHVCAVLAAALIAQPALAQSSDTQSGVAPVLDPVAVEHARKLLDAMGSKAAFDRVFEPLAPLFAQAVLGKLADSPTGMAALAKINAQPGGTGRAGFERLLQTEFLTGVRARYDDLLDKSARHYAEQFSLAEIDQLTTFYSSGVGAKYIRIQPELQQMIKVDSSAIGAEVGAQAGAKAYDEALRGMGAKGSGE